MWRSACQVAVACGLSVAALCSEAAFAQKQGGILRIYHWDSPPSLSIHEEPTISTVVPMMGVFNNLIIYKQDVPQNSLQSIVPDLAINWSWNEDWTALTFRLREGVKWHDGRRFTASDVECTWSLLLGNSNVSLRTNPRKSWYQNLERVTADGDRTVTFHLRRPQPAFIALLASGFSPVYPCHVSPRDMRQHPIGTGPFKFVEFKPNESIKLVRNPDYWKPGRPYLDGIEYTIIRNMSTAMLSFVAGKFDITFGGLTVPLTRDIANQSPQADCELNPTNVSRNLIINPDAAPFDNPDLRRAMALSLDRKAFIDIITEGKGNVGGVMLPPPDGVWGMPAELLHTLPGYGPSKRLAVKVSTRDIPPFRDPAVVLLDQLKEIYIDAELETIDTTQWFPKVNRKDYTVALNLTGNGIDEPDQNFYENYVCGAEGNYNKYCNPELDKMVDRQSMEGNQEKRKALVWEIERKLAEDGARPIIFYALGGNCRQPDVKGLTIMSNSIYNGWRMEDVWLDK